MKQYTREFSKNLKLAYPVMIGQLGQVLVGLVDNLMVGKLGASALAAVSLGNGVFFMFVSIAIGFSLSITPLAAEADGKNELTKAKSILKNGTLLCFIISLLLIGCIWLVKPYLHLLNQPTEVVLLAVPYLEIISYSMIPFVLFQAIKQFADGMSATTFAMYAAVLGNVINVALNYGLIYGKWGFPRMEVEGAALGTFISRILMFVFLVYLMWRSVKFKSYFTQFFKFIFNLTIFKKIMSLGFPTALQMLFEFGIFTTSVFLSGKLSTQAQAANQIALNLGSITFMIAVGLGVTATVRVGNQLGLGNYKELKRIMRSIFLLVLILQSVFAVIFFITRNVLPGFYIDDPAVTHIAASLIVVLAFFQLSDGFQVTILGALRGLQDVAIPSVLLFVAYWCLGFPISYYLGIETQLGAVGIWIGLLTGLTAASVFCYLRYRYLVGLKS